VNSLDCCSYRLIGKLTAFLQLQEFSLRNRWTFPLPPHGSGKEHPRGDSPDRHIRGIICTFVPLLSIKGSKIHIYLGYTSTTRVRPLT
jgi:hypothetical protein